MSLILQQIYVENQTAGAVTEPTGGSWISAYCLHLGITEPVNGTWLQALCEEFGITEPQFGSWLIALSYYYGEFQPVNGTWWGALAIASAPTPGDLVWDTTTTNWEAEATLWNA